MFRLLSQQNVTILVVTRPVTRIHILKNNKSYCIYACISHWEVQAIGIRLQMQTQESQ